MGSLYMADEKTVVPGSGANRMLTNLRQNPHAVCSIMEPGATLMDGKRVRVHKAENWPGPARHSRATGRARRRSPARPRPQGYRPSRPSGSRRSGRSSTWSRGRRSPSVLHR
ncbi:MAG: hypothetical protein ABFC89_10880 [Methanospirillum sp.]